MPTWGFRKHRIKSVKPTRKIYVITWIDLKDMVTAFENKEMAKQFCDDSNGKYMWTELIVQ